MWRILVSLMTVVGGAIAARIYGRPGTPASPASPAPRTARESARFTERRDSVDGRDDRITAEGPAFPRPGDPLRPGWNRARPEKIPRPTYWPVTLALGIALALWGAITTIFLWVPGVLLVIIGTTGWIRELLYESE